MPPWQGSTALIGVYCLHYVYLVMLVDSTISNYSEPMLTLGRYTRMPTAEIFASEAPEAAQEALRAGYSARTESQTLAARACAQVAARACAQVASCTPVFSAARRPSAAARAAARARAAAARPAAARSVPVPSGVKQLRSCIMSLQSQQKQNQKQEQDRDQHEQELVPARPSRAVMYALVSLQGLPNWVIRNGSEYRNTASSSGNHP